MKLQTATVNTNCSNLDLTGGYALYQYFGARRCDAAGLHTWSGL